MPLSIEQQQVQHLSPRMIQSLQILQMNGAELQDYVEKMMSENPTIEVEPVYDLGNEMRFPEENQANLWGKIYARNKVGRSAYEFVAGTSGETLEEYLKSQIDTRSIPAVTLRTIEDVIHALDANGYLEEDSVSIANRTNQTLQNVLKAEQIVKGLEPIGVGARSLSECLSLQLRSMGEEGLPLQIVEHYLEDMAQGHYHLISKKTGYSRKDIQNACNLIKTLNPKPGTAFCVPETPDFIYPDIVVRNISGNIEISIPGDLSKGIAINTYYQQLLKKTDDPEVAAYLRQKIGEARNLIDAIRNRTNTLYRCVQIIAEIQKDYFMGRSLYLLPMSLHDIAERLDIHESTVNRAIHGKYLQGPSGTTKITDMFGRHILANEGKNISTICVKELIHQYIEEEDKHKPMSDQRLCELLGRKGVVISRRTISKYREEMGIAAASCRRQFD